MKEGDPRRRHIENSPYVGEVVVPFPGLRPETTHSKTGEVITPSNIDSEEMKEQLKEIFDKNSKRGKWLREMRRDIREGKRSVVYLEELGALTFLVAAGVAFEFGVRHGKDIKILTSKLRRKPKKS